MLLLWQINKIMHSFKQTNNLCYNCILLSLFIISPLCWSTVWSLQVRKNTSGVLFIIKMILINKQLRTLPWLNPLSFYIINCNITFIHTQILKIKIVRWKNLFWSLDNNSNGRPFLTTNSWKALKQRLLRTPELALVCLARTRWSNN